MFVKSFVGTACACLVVASFGVNAAVYNISSVLQGNDGGYGFSSFHDANDSTPMSGPKLADISGPVISGTYNDMTGAFDAVLTVSDAGPNVTLSGTLLFDGSGFLSASSMIAVDFDGVSANPLLRDTVIGFLPGDICCSGAGDPNSFKNIGGNMVMSLWGADWGYSGDFNDALANPYQGSKLGMDLRIQLTAVPVPAAVWLFGSGLIGLIGLARRKA